MKRLTILFVFISAWMCVSAQYTLDSCLVWAQRNSPIVRQYGIAEQLEEYTLKNAAMAYVPQFALSAQASYQSAVASFPEAFQTMLQNMTGKEMEGIHPDQYKVMLSLNQTIWDGGYTASQRQLARADKEVALQRTETDLHDLCGRVSQIYFGILILTEQLSQNSLMQQQLENSRNIVKAYVDNGTAMESELHQIMAEELSNRQRKVQIESSLENYRFMLSLLTGKSFAPDATFAKPAVTDGDCLPSDEVHRPELKLFDARLSYLDVQRKALNSAVMPKIGLFAQGFYGNPGFDMFADMMDYKWSLNGMVGVQLSWNISGFYTLGRNRKKIGLSQEQIRIQRDIFLDNNRIQQAQYSIAISQMKKVMADDDEIIELRSSICKASEAKLENGTISVSDHLTDILKESQAKMAKSLHEIEWIKNIYELQHTIN